MYELLGGVVWLVAGQVEETGDVLPFQVLADSMGDAKAAISLDEPGITPIAAISLGGLWFVLERMRSFMGRRGEDDSGRVWFVTSFSFERGGASEIVASDTREEAVRLAGIGGKRALAFNLEDACSVEKSLLQFCAQVTDHGCGDLRCGFFIRFIKNPYLFHRLAAETESPSSALGLLCDSRWVEVRVCSSIIH